MGAMEMEDPVCPLLHKYELPPDAVRILVLPAQTVVLPLIVAWLLSYVFGPVVSILNARKVPTALSTALILIIMLPLPFASTTVFGCMSLWLIAAARAPRLPTNGPEHRITL